jgi:diadenosine tetraphosphate (Ap4A) HIT family hydrolase
MNQNRPVDKTLDKVIETHTPGELERLFENHFLYDHPLYSLMAEPTEIPWMQFIPKINTDDAQAVGELYGEIHSVAFYLQRHFPERYGHFNVAKIGNKCPYYHIHLVFRTERDEAWPNPIWCQEPLSQNPKSVKQLQEDLRDFFV